MLLKVSALLNLSLKIIVDYLLNLLNLFERLVIAFVPLPKTIVFFVLFLRGVNTEDLLLYYCIRHHI